MSLIEEALHGIWGAIRIIKRDPQAFEEFNISADGFWRSFGAILPVAILAWPLFQSSHQFAVETAEAEGRPLPEFSLARDYAYLLIAFAVWPVVSAVLAQVLGVARNYSRYLIAYNWLQVPAMALSLIPHALHLLGILGWQLTALFSLVIFASLAYLSWYVALKGFETTPLTALAFLLADYASSFALDAAIR